MGVVLFNELRTFANLTRNNQKKRKSTETMGSPVYPHFLRLIALKSLMTLDIIGQIFRALAAPIAAVQHL